jgi:single-stranded-DNA-specific exonuclease
MDKAPVIIVGEENWHPGLSGLVAGRLKEKYDKPAIVVTYARQENGELEGRGSGRSVPGVNMGAAFIDARNEGVILKGGGHAMAAGFTLRPDQMDDFIAFVTDHIEKQMAGQEMVTESRVDCILSVRGATPDLVKTIQNNIGPFGQEQPEPLFVLPYVRLYNVDVVGKDHVRALVGDWEGGARLKAISFRSAETPMGQALLKHWRQTPFHLAGHLKINHWNGRESVEMHIQDAAFANEHDAAKKISA